MGLAKIQSSQTTAGLRVPCMSMGAHPLIATHSSSTAPSAKSSASTVNCGSPSSVDPGGTHKPAAPPSQPRRQLNIKGHSPLQPLHCPLCYTIVMYSQLLQILYSAQPQSTKKKDTPCAAIGNT